MTTQAGSSVPARRVLIAGREGQLATALLAAFRAAGWEAVALGRLHGRHTIGKGFDDGDGHGVTVLPENAGHAAFSAH